jgi:hypothetical protein
VIFGRFVEIAQAFQREGVQYILIGGVAVNLHGIIRATEDVDFFIRPYEENIERMKAALRSLWDDPAIDEIQASEFAGEYPTLRYGPPESDLVINILTNQGTKLCHEDLETEAIAVEGVPLTIATPRTLVTMKRGTLRQSTRQTPPPSPRRSTSRTTRCPWSTGT